MSSRKLRSIAGVTRRLRPALVAARLRARVAFSTGVALLVDDVVELLRDLVVDAAEVEPVEAVLALAAELVHQLPEPLEALPVAVLHALLHQSAQRAVDVAVVEEVVVELVEERIGVEVEALLRAIPPGVGESGCHVPTLQPATRRRAADDPETVELAPRLQKLAGSLRGAHESSPHLRVHRPLGVHQLHRRVRRRCRGPDPQRLPHAGARDRERPGCAHREVARRRMHDGVRRAVERDRVRAGPRAPLAEVCAPLSLRVGIASGYALLFDGDDYIGSAVNMASRLCDIAGPFEVLLPTMQLERLPEGVVATEHGEVELRGFPGPIDVVELSGVPVHTPLNDTGELWTRTPFH
jgi:hypothetical protein